MRVFFRSSPDLGRYADLTQIPLAVDPGATLQSPRHTCAGLYEIGKRDAGTRFEIFTRRTGAIEEHGAVKLRRVCDTALPWELALCDPRHLVRSEGTRLNSSH